MAEYPVNKGIGHSVEFKGLKTQYLFIFVGCLLATFILFVVMYMACVPQWFCIGTGVASASLVVFFTFRLKIGARREQSSLLELPSRRPIWAKPTIDTANMG